MSNSTPAVEGIFLDMYGTVTSGDRAAVESTCAAIIADTGLVRPDTGLPIAPREFAVLWGERFFAAMNEANEDRFEPLHRLEARTLRETLATLGRSVDPAPYIARLIQYWRDPPLHPDTREFFARCPVPVCIVSNVDRDDLEAALARHDLRVAATVTSEETRSYKPHGGIFRAALARTAWRSDRVLHVGDSLHSDVGGARAAGLRSVWVNRAHRIHDIGTAEPDDEVGDLMGVVSMLWERANRTGRRAGGDSNCGPCLPVDPVPSPQDRRTLHAK